MNELEELLRETFEARVAEQPALTAPAQRAIRAARTVRRRRTLFGGLAAFVAVLVTGAGVSALPAGSTRPAPSVSQVALALAVVAPPDRILFGDGTSIALGATVRTVYRVSTGWLAVGSSADSSGEWLKFAAWDGSVHTLLSGVESVVVAPDGQHLAWQTATTLNTGRVNVNGFQVDTEHSTGRPLGLIPVAVSGTAVVLENAGAGDGFDVWVPTRGGYVPSGATNRKIVQLYGVAPDGRSFLALAPESVPGSQGGCLVLLDPADHLAATRTQCGLGLTLGEARVSPDGRWLAGPVVADNGTSATELVDVGRFTIAQRWPYQVGYWLDSSTMVTRLRNQAFQLTVGRTDAVPVTLTAVPPGRDFDWVLAPNGTVGTPD
jgi:hypothetical protein